MEQWPTYVIPTVTIILLWIGTFVLSFVRSPYLEYLHIQGINNQLSSANANLAQEEIALNTKINALQRPAASPPKVEASTPFRWEKAEPFMRGVGASDAALIVANTAISNLSFKLKCDIPCLYAENGSVEFDNYSGIIAHQMTTPDSTVAWVKLSKPGILEIGKSVLIAVSGKDGHKPTILTVNGLKPSL
jgi:hypothetical protein